MTWMESPEFLSLTDQQREDSITAVTSSRPNPALASYTGIPLETVATLRHMRRREREHTHIRTARTKRAAPKLEPAAAPSEPVCRLLAALRQAHPRAQGEPTRETIGAWARPPLPRPVRAVSIARTGR